MKLSRKQIREGLETVPVDAILGKEVSRELTAKQKRFALEVAKGATKADAYRRAYKADASPHTIVSKPYHLARDDRVKAEIEAYQAAIEAARYRTPAALRELVIQSLVSVVINPETKDSVKVAAAKVLGTVTEVAAFTERKEVRTISTSEDARAKIMGELRRLVSQSAEDATVIEADELLRELGAAEDSSDPAENAEPAAREPHPSPTPPSAEMVPAAHEHTIPPKMSHAQPISEDAPPQVSESRPISPPPNPGEPPPCN